MQRLLTDPDSPQPASHFSPSSGRKDAGLHLLGKRGAAPGLAPDQAEPSLLFCLFTWVCTCPQAHSHTERGREQTFDPDPFFHGKPGPEEKGPSAYSGLVHRPEVGRKHAVTTIAASDPPSASPHTHSQPHLLPSLSSQAPQKGGLHLLSSTSSLFISLLWEPSCSDHFVAKFDGQRLDP